ncbi:MAG: phosphoribosylaminoimidazolesuccinocarboxamide synthase [Gammaproteobacteria bacterium]|nr:MAG: phosphoribosylaminoimidazolesuccinocarboxamide synthase [Gammaproteobacteria bacterium]
MRDDTQIIKSLPLIQQGKVRDIYQIDDDNLLMITSDRISAFDVVLPTPLPNKGRILTSIAKFWMNKFADIVPNHLNPSLSLKKILTDKKEYEYANGRAMIVKKLKPLKIEAIVRGYIIGSGWEDYQKTGKVCGIELQKNLKLAQKLEKNIFTPSTKADIGDHDQNISYQKAQEIIGADLAKKVRDISLKLYQKAADYADKKGITIADTKFEFGEDENNNLYLIDEVLTPDSSRFWDKNSYQIGISPKSFDKQFIRDYLLKIKWNKTAPAPELPTDIVKKTTDKYKSALDKITGT